MKGSTRRDILAVIQPVGSKSVCVATTREHAVSSALWLATVTAQHAPLISPAMVVVSSYLLGSQRSICEMPLLPASRLLRKARQRKSAS